jgi:hypothetical protein
MAGVLAGRRQSLVITRKGRRSLGGAGLAWGYPLRTRIEFGSRLGAGRFSIFTRCTQARP